MKKIAIPAFIAMIVCVSAVAQTATPRANTRQKAQRARIVEGRKDGEITKGEAAVVNKQQRGVRRTERRAKADGEVTVAEKARIESKQDRASRTIRRAKTNEVQKQEQR